VIKESWETETSAENNLEEMSEGENGSDHWQVPLR
jgi:hypothetical protein